MTRVELEALYQQYGSLVKRRANMILKNDAEATDAMQDVFVRVVQSAHQFRQEASPVTWLYKITTNLCLNRLRDKSRRAKQIERYAHEVDDSAQNYALAQADVLKVLQQVPATLAEPAMYYYVDGMSQQEVADLLKIPRRTICRRIDQFTEAAQALLSLPQAKDSAR